MKLDVQKLDGKKGGSVDLDKSVFGLEPRTDILHRMVRYQLAARQAGTHKVKERGEVKKSSKKIYAQKGTGNARQGNGAASQFRGGGKAHGPRVRSHAHDLPKKVRRLAMRHALSAKAGAGELIILDSSTLKSAKTKDVAGGFKKLGIENAFVVGGAQMDEGFARAARNIKNIDVVPSVGANVYDILRRHTLVLTQEAVADLEARLK
jgi:large subunit ribosomal protein L4